MNLNLLLRLTVFLFLFGVTLTPAESIAQDKDVSGLSMLSKSIEETLKAENKAIDYVNGLKIMADQLNNAVNAEINSYKFHGPAYNNQLLNPDVQKKTLEKTLLDITESHQKITTRYNDLKLKQEEIQKLSTQTKELSEVTKIQIEDIRAEAEKNPDVVSLINKLENLTITLSSKQELLESILEIYASLLFRLNETQQRYTAQANKYTDAIETHKKEDLLVRKKIIESMGFQKILADTRELGREVKNFFTKEFWKDQFGFIKTSGDLFIGSFILALIIVIVFVFRVRMVLRKTISHSALSDKFWTQTILLLMRKSFILVGATVSFYSILQTERFQPKPMLIETIVNLLLIWLFTKWLIDVMKVFREEEKPFFQDNQRFYIRSQILIIRLFAVFYIIVSWIYTSDTAVIIFGRLLFEVMLYIATVAFWRATIKKIKGAGVQDDKSSARVEFKKIISIVKPMTYIIITVGVMLDITGYGPLAQLWFISCGRCFIVAIWGGLLFKAIREWNPVLNKVQDSFGDDGSEAKNSLQWVGIQLLTIAWSAGLLVMFVLACGGKQSVLNGLFQLVKMPLNVGSMQFSILGLMVAVLILLITKGLSRVWRHVFFENILSQSGMEEGLKESVTTISIYVIWSIGILLALNAFGFNSTSLTVALGALGIGLGFGLQNIFNNFLSGIILLFERPIQVGDDIELGGVWATVKKINVRSTLVQTYDNASLIIPNSDLISNQVTNWSFKDKRLRRNIEVGVAYGSDIELVKKTLIEVAESIPRVLRYPLPDVIFRDFGDNALVFKLRIWTWVDCFYAVETEVRFAINRLFNERNIVIAFPQQDIHIKKEDAPQELEGLKRGKNESAEPTQD